MLTLEPQITYTLRTTQPLDRTTASPLGARQYWQVSEARRRSGLGQAGGHRHRLDADE